MDGVIVVDKPQGLTSHDVVAIARRSLRERRIGHTGTLDPLATGVLPLACGRATRLVRFLIASDKDYDAGIRFGVTTDSYDMTGNERTRSGLIPTREAVEIALGRLRGEYLQLPPAYSAKKVQGRRAYALARQDEQVTLAPARVRVARADLVELSGASARVAITCSSGFYVRSFAHSLGEILGTGACLESLRRTRSGEFSLDRAVGLEQLQQGTSGVADRWIPIDHLLSALPEVRLTEEGCRRVSHGQDVGPHLLTDMDSGGVMAGEADAWVRLLDEQGRLLALGTAGSTPGALHPTVVLI
jgi:tRNA pseudouridine55 synthase